MNEFNIVLAGIGGQGTLLAAEALGIAAVKDGLNVRVGEIHGMAQRGGSVVSTVRIGDKVLAPTVTEGQANILLGFERLETLRNMKYTSEKTTVVMNTVKIPPTELAFKRTEYPSVEEVVGKICSFTKNVILVDAPRLAKKAGSNLTQNIVLLGSMAGTVQLPVRTQSLMAAIKELVPEKHGETNVRAFEMGYRSTKKVEQKD
jgi:indolepyruvate ferredoxin oxidoreductase beta subunit